uniref:Uncharacterized protein n=1 Tax=Romanomermis culicivorax TaxID=13658 RepID=A0A915IIY0_ROMCU
MSQKIFIRYFVHLKPKLNKKAKNDRYQHDVQLFLLTGTFNAQCEYRFVNNGVVCLLDNHKKLKIGFRMPKTDADRMLSILE